MKSLSKTYLTYAVVLFELSALKCLCSINSKKMREVILLDKQVMQLNVREIVTQIAMKQIVVMRVEMRSR